MKLALVGWLGVALLGCSIMDRSDSFGAEGRIKVGGILSYIVDLDIHGKVGFYKQFPDRSVCQACGKEIHDAPESQDVDRDPFGLQHFL